MITDNNGVKSLIKSEMRKITVVVLNSPVVDIPLHCLGGEKLWFDALTYGLSLRVGGVGKQDGDNLRSKSNTKSQGKKYITEILSD